MSAAETLSAIGVSCTIASRVSACRSTSPPCGTVGIGEEDDPVELARGDQRAQLLIPAARTALKALD